jgi:hypothetical protein
MLYVAVTIFSKVHQRRDFKGREGTNRIQQTYSKPTANAPRAMDNRRRTDDKENKHIAIGDEKCQPPSPQKRLPL